MTILVSITGNNAKVLLEDPYLNLNATTTTIVQRVFIFVFYNDQELDGRFVSSLILSAAQFTGPFYNQNPLTFVSNVLPTNFVKQRDVQQITFTGKVSRNVAQTALTDYWQNPIRQGLTNANVLIIQFQQFLVYSAK